MTRTGVWLTLLLTLAGAGCAGLSAQRARTRVLETEVGGYRYRQPMEVVWPQVRLYLASQGLTLGGKDAEEATGARGLVQLLTSVAKETSQTPRGGLVLETDWTNGGRRWRAEAWPDAGGCRVVITRIAENQSHRGHDDWSVRDYQYEFDLLRRVDPEGASRIDDLLDDASGLSARPAPAAAPAAPAPSAPAPAASPAPAKTE